MPTIEYRAQDGQTMQLHFASSLHRFLVGKGSYAPPGPIVELFSELFHKDNFPHSAEKFVANKAGVVATDYYAIRGDGDALYISYLPANRTQQLSPDGDWLRTARQTIKAGRWLRSIISQATLTHYKINDRYLEDFSAGMRGIADVPPAPDDVPPLRCVEMTGYDIGLWYATYRYAEINKYGGGLYNSCFRYDQDLKDYYGKSFPASALHPEVPAYLDPHMLCPGASLLCVLNADNQLEARAMTWRADRAVVVDSKTAEYTLEDAKWLDRPYCNNSAAEAFLTAYARAHGYYYHDGWSSDLCRPRATGGLTQRVQIACWIPAGTDERPPHHKYFDYMQYATAHDANPKMAIVTKTHASYSAYLAALRNCPDACADPLRTWSAFSMDTDEKGVEEVSEHYQQQYDILHKGKENPHAANNREGDKAAVPHAAEV